VIWGFGYSVICLTHLKNSF